MFSPFIGLKIKSVEVNTYKTGKEPMLRVPFDTASYERDFVSDIVLRFENGMGLRVRSQARQFPQENCKRIGRDMTTLCVIECVDAQNEVLKIKFSQLRRALFNWEDLHVDDATGFASKSHTIFFGKIGSEHTDEPYMTLRSSVNDKSFLTVSNDDFILPGWCITLVTGEEFDEYGEYRFSVCDWRKILDEALKLLSFENFNALYEYVASIYVFGLSWQLKHRGEEFWEKREELRVQLDDIIKWTELVLPCGATMNIYGF